MKQVKLILDALNPQSAMMDSTRRSIQSHLTDELNCADSHVTVYYDAWIHDNHEDPILSLIYSTIASYQSDFTTEKKRSLIGGVAAIASMLTGRDINTALERCQGNDLFQPFIDSDDIRSLVKDFISNLIEEHGNRLVFFIDELDRCKPDYAIRFLERIKHYFDDTRVTFVFSVSFSQLQSIVKNYYGTELCATRYLDKFFDLRLSLPDVNIEYYMHNRLEVYQNTDFNYNCIETARYFKFSLREVERFVRLMKIAVKPCYAEMMGSTPEMRSLRFSISHVLPVMVGLQMVDMNKYLEFISGNNPGPLVDILMTPKSDIVQYPPINPYDEEYNVETHIIKVRNSPETTLSLSDRLLLIYQALFSKSFDVHNYRIVIADMHFTAETQEALREVAALLAPYSNYI